VGRDIISVARNVERYLHRNTVTTRKTSLEGISPDNGPQIPADGVVRPWWVTRRNVDQMGWGGG